MAWSARCSCGVCRRGRSHRACKRLTRRRIGRLSEVYLPTDEEGCLRPWHPDSSAHDRLMHDMKRRSDRVPRFIRILQIHGQGHTHEIYRLCSRRGDHIAMRIHQRAIRPSMFMVNATP